MSLKNLKGKDLVNEIINLINNDNLTKDDFLDFMEATENLSNEEKRELSPSNYNNLTYYLFTNILGCRLNNVYNLKDRYFIIQKLNNYEPSDPYGYTANTTTLTLLDDKVTEKEPIEVAQTCYKLIKILFELIKEEKIYTLYPYETFIKNMNKNYFKIVLDLKHLKEFDNLVKEYGRVSYKDGLTLLDVRALVANTGFNYSRDARTSQYKNFINNVFDKLPSGYKVNDLINMLSKATALSTLELVIEGIKNQKDQSLINSQIYVSNIFSILREVTLI